jgi:hypothetical protein
MTASVKKEFRALLLPWSVAISAAFSLPIVKILADWMRNIYIGGLVERLPGVFIFVACLAMAAMSFGVEIHNRTFGLMLVQPVERSRIWWSKMLPLVGAHISIGVAFVAGQSLAGAVWESSFESWNGSGVFVFVALLAGVLCSSAFWTLLSRSIIGGMVLPLAVQALLAGVIAWFASGTSTAPPEELESRLFMALGTAASIHCVLFLYLGWRKFSRLEWREGFTGDSGIAVLPALRVKESRSAAPCGPWTGILRKELRLHRPVFFLSALFVVCWLTALGLRSLRPGWEARFDTIFGMILLIYLPFAWLLSGCISLGEEKQLGSWGWHLTLSVSGLRQWAIKISFALLITLILGFLVPVVAWLAAKAPHIQMTNSWWADASSIWLFLLAAVCGTVISFWSVTMFGTVVRAVLFTFLGSGALLFGGGLVVSIGRETRLLQGICSWLIIEFQLLPYYFFSDWINVAGLYIGSSLLLVLLLRQSYVHCRREPSRRVIFKCSLILVISLFLPLWLSSDISSSASYMSPKIAALYNNLRETTSKLPAFIKEDVMYEARLESFDDAVKKAKPISIEEIDRTVVLSPETRRWLRGTTLRFIGPPVASKFSQTGFFVWVNVTFPDGRNFLVSTGW